MAKKKYIDVYKCREDFYNDVLSILSDDTTNDRANEIIDVFDSLPAADVQEVVRCKDCKYLKADTLDQKAVYFCTQNVFARRRVELDDYCSRGARMDGEEE